MLGARFVSFDVVVLAGRNLSVASDRAAVGGLVCEANGFVVFVDLLVSDRMGGDGPVGLGIQVCG